MKAFTKTTNCTKKVDGTAKNFSAFGIGRAPQPNFQLRSGATGDEFENPTRTEGVWAYGRILCIRELERGHN